VIILSAALDLVGPNVPKGVVLLADVIPSFLTKLCAPYFIHKVPYSVRIWIFVALSAGGMLLIALTPDALDKASIGTKMVGILLASLSSGGGELSFLGLTHYYGHFSLAAWGSGTGGAGLIGAGAYVLATTTIGLSVQTSLFAFSFLPVIMLISFFLILPRDALRASEANGSRYEVVATDEPEEEPLNDEGSLLSQSGRSFVSAGHSPFGGSMWENFRRNLARSRGLFLP